MPIVGLLLLSLAGPVLLARAHPVTVNGASADWFARAPLFDNTGLIARNATDEGEYIWADRPGDERTDFASPDQRVDMTQVRFTATSTNLYALVKLAALEVASGDGAPMIQIAIDTDGVSGSGDANLVAGADTQVADVAQWEYLLQTRFGSGASTLNVWHLGSATVAGAVAQGGDGTVELSVPWSSLGLSGPPGVPLRTTIATFRSTVGDQAQDIGGPSVSDALDVVTDYGDPRTTGYPNTSTELADQRIDYFSQVHFNTAGEVRAPLVVQKVTTDLGATPGAEWIQVTNATSSSLNISGFALGDEETPDGGEGMYQFPAGTILPVGGNAKVARSATDYFSVYATNPDFEFTSTDPSVPDLIPFGAWGAAVPDFGNAGDEVMVLDNSPSTQVDIVTYGTGAYAGVISRPASAASEIVTRAASLRDTDNNINDFSLSNCAGTIVFDGGPTGVGTSWHVAANWRDTTTNLDRLPTTTDHVCIPDLGIASVSFDSSTTSVLSITAAETVTVSGGTLNMTSTAQPSEFGTLSLTGSGTIGGLASFTVNGQMTWSSGTLTADSTTARAMFNGAVTINGPDHFLSARQVDLNADTTWTSGRILYGFGSTINNGAGHTFAVQTSADFQYWGGTATFNNSGALTKTVDTTLTDVPNAIVFNNAGSVAVTTGTLDFAGGGLSPGSFNVSPGAGLVFSGGTQTLSPASTLSGSGSLSFAGGTTNVNGSYTHTGPLNVSAGTANFSPALNSNALAVTAGTLNVNSTSSVSSLTLSGTIGGSGNLTVNGATTWTNNGFTADNTSVRTIFNGPLTMSGSDHQVQVRRLELNGATSWTASRILIGFGGTMVNNPGAVFTATGEQDFQYWGGTLASFDNLGTLNREVVGTTTTIPSGVIFNNSSSVVVAQGQLELGGGGNSTGSFAVPLGSTLRFDGNTNNLNSGSTLSGAGSVTVASGITNINGTYTHTGPLNVSGGTANFSPALNNNPLSVTSGTLNLNSSSSVPSLSLSGTIGGSGNLTVNGATTWTNNGFAADNTSVKTTFNGPLTMNGADHHLQVRRLELNGATNWTASRFLIGFGGTVVNNPGAVFTATGEQDFQYWGGTLASFDNLGTLNREVVGTTTTIPSGVIFNNSGSVVVSQGQLELGGGGNSTGSFAVPLGSTLRFDGNTNNLNLGSSISGAGTVRFASGVVNSVGDYNIPNLTDVTGGTVNFNLTSFADETHATAGTMTQSGGVVGGTDTLDITGSFTWSGGTQTGTGQTVILPGATMTLTGSGKTLSGLRTLLNQGTTNSLDSGAWSVGGGSPAGGTILNEGTWNIGDGQNINQGGGQMEFRNAPGAVVNKITTPGGQASNWSSEDGAGSSDGGIVPSIPGWSRTSNFTVVQYGATGFPTLGQAPPGAGTNFFAGGPTTALSSIAQNIDISPWAGAIDSGDFTTFLEGYLGGTGTENDNMTVRAIFLSGPTELGSLTLAPVLAADRGNVTGFLFRSGSSAIPPGTRTVRLEQIANRASGGSAYNNAYSDKIKIRFRSSDAFVGTSYIDIPFDNDSTAVGGGVHVQHGTFNLAEGGPNSNVGSFSVDDGGSLQFGGGNHTLSAASTLTGPGTAQFSGGSATILGAYNPTRTNIDGGTATFNAPATTTVLNQSSGVLAGSSTFTINGPSPASSWTGGTMTGTGTTRLASGATMNVSGAGVKDATGGRVTDNQGTWNFTGTGDMRSGTSTFNNNGVFNVQTDSDFQNNLGGTGQFNNNGTLQKTVGAGTTFFSMGVDNDGSLLANTGTFELWAGDGGANVSSGSYSVPATLAFAGGTHDLAAASSISGAGTARFQGGTVNVLGSYNPTKTEINGGTVNFEAPASTTWLDQSSGVLAGTGTFTINGPSPASSWTGGTMTGTGTTRLASGATMNVSGAGVKDATGGRVTDNQGTWNFTGTGDMRSGTSTFNNNGVFNVQTDSDFQNNLGGTGQFNNNGTLQKTVGAGTTFFSMGVDNDGSLLANTGTFELWAGDGGANVSSGSYSVPATLAFAGGTHDLAAASSISGAGTARFQGGTVNVLGSYNPTKTEINGGTVNFEAPASTTWLDQSSGVLAGTGTFTINGPSPASSWTGGTMTGTGTTRLASGATMNVSGAGVKDATGGRVTDNQGTWNFTGTGDMRSGTSTFQNNGVFDIQTDVNFQNNLGGVGQFNNTGTLKKTGGSGTSAFVMVLDNQAAGTVLVQAGTLNPAATFTNSGTADVRVGTVLRSTSAFTNFAGNTLTGGTYLVAGTFRFNSANIVNNAATIILNGAASAITDNAGTPANALANFNHNATGGVFRIINGRNLFSSGTRGPNMDNDGLLGGTGTIFANVTNDVGTVDPGASPGTLTVNGNYTQNATGTLKVEIASAASFDKLVVTGTGGNASLNGTVDVDNDALFVPPVVTALRIVDATARTGQFSNLVDNQLGDRAYEARYGSTFADLVTVPLLSVADLSVNEGAGTALVTVARSIPTPEIMNVDYATSHGTAAANDYVAQSGTLTFGVADVVQTFTVPINSDNIDEFNETFNVTLTDRAADGRSELGDGQAIVTINDDDAIPSVSVDDITVVEGNSGTTAANFTLTLSGPSEKPISFQAATSNGTALAPADYAARPLETLTFPTDPTPLTETYTVAVVGETLNELDETLNVNLSNPVNLSLLDPLGVGTIDDDDTLTWSVDDVTVTEGGLATFTVSLNRTSASAQSVTFATSDGTATSGADYTARTDTLTIPAGSTNGTFTVQTSAETLDEVDETFNVTLSGQSEGNLVDAVGVGTIDDNDGPTLSIANPPVVDEGNSGSVNAIFTVTRSAVSPQTVSATFTAADGTATQPGDYAPTTGTVTFAPGDPATKTVTVPVNGDLLDEIDEQFLTGLSAPVDATIAGPPAIATINDDDGPNISIANTTVAEGDSGTSLYDVTVTLSAASPQNVTMDVASANGTALAGDDYEAIAAGQTLTIPAGATSGTVQVATIGDVNDEADETFFVNLSNAVDSGFADNQATVTIDDDDGVGGAGSQLSIGDFSLTEGDSGATTATFTVTRTLANSGVATVNYATAGATATPGADFTPETGTLTFPLGDSSEDITIDVTGDRLDELDESFFVNLSGASGASLLDAIGLGTIADDDSSPIAAAQSVSTNEDVSLGITLGASDADGDTLIYSIVSVPTHGVLSGTGASRTYAPAANYNGPDSFTFRASDGVNDSNIATVSVTVTSVNDAPVAVGASRTLAEDAFEAVTLAATDVEGDALTYSIVTGPTNGVLSGTGANRTYTPNANYNGPDSFTFKANDGALDSNVATVSLTVTPVNDAPNAVNDAATVVEDGSQSVDVRANDSDVDGNPLTITVVGTPLHGTAVLQAGNILYTPNANYNGGDSFAYTISDGAGGTASAVVAMTVTAVNDAPVSQNGSATVGAGTPEVITLQASDIDGDALGYSIVSGPTQGTLSTPSGNQVTYTANVGATGSDSFTFKANDGTVDSNVSTVSITISGGGSGLLLSIDDVTVGEGNSGAAPVQFTVSLSAASASTVTVNFATSSGTATAGSDFTAASGLVTFAPGQTTRPVMVDVLGDRLDENVENYTVNLSAPSGASLLDAQGLGTITDNDSSPVAAPQSVSTPEDSVLGITLGASDGDGDTLSFSIVSAPAHGVLTGTGANRTYTPAANYNGPDSFTFRANDGVNDSNIATISVTVTSVNDAPVAVGASRTLAEDAFEAVTLAASDVEGDALTYSIVNAPLHGILSGSGAERTYTPVANYNGPDSFTFKANDGALDSNVATISLTVTPVNDAPNAVNDAASVVEDGSQSVDVRANDSDVDGNPLTITVVGPPIHGTAVLQAGNVLYTPDPNYNGSDSFAYTISDGAGGTASAVVTMTVTGVNDAPVAEDSSATVAQDTAELIPLLASDIDGDTLGYAIVAGPTHGTLSGGGVGRTYTPNPGYNGPDSFTFKANDGALDSNVATVSITVTPGGGGGAPTVSVNDVTVPAEGNSGDTDAVFTISLSSANAIPAEIRFSTANGSATAPGDYGTVITTRTFAPGETSKTVVVKVNGDTTDEIDETFLANLAVVSGGVTLADGQGIGTITDDDAPVALSIGNVSIAEGNSGSATATMTATLNAASGKTVSVNWATADGTANAPADYTTDSGSLTFAPGETSKSVTVSVNGDSLVEANEAYAVNLTSPTNATIQVGTGTGTIVNDDAAVGPGPPPPPPPPPPPAPPVVRIIHGVTCTKTGTARRDVLRGTRGRDVICGLGGNDLIFGLGGNDVLIGGPGSDTLRGGAGKDNLFGDSGNDVLRGEDGHDKLNGANGKDRLFGGRGADVLRGGAGNDHLNGGPGRDVHEGGPGRDYLFVRDRVRGNDVVRGGPGVDRCMTDFIKMCP